MNPPKVGQLMFHVTRKRVYGKVVYVKVDHTIRWASFKTGSVVDTGRGFTWMEMIEDGVGFADELPASLEMPPLAACFKEAPDGAVWAADGFGPDGPGRCKCPRCGASVSTNGLARSSHKRSKTCRDSGPTPKGWT